MTDRLGIGVRAVLGNRRTIAMFALAWTFALAPDSAKANDAPVLQTFNVVHIFDDWWLLYGEFDDEAPEYCIVAFGGILEGHSTMGDADGTFSYVLEVSPSTFGVVSAQVLDLGDLWSNVLEDVIDP